MAKYSSDDRSSGGGVASASSRSQQYGKQQLPPTSVSRSQRNPESQRASIRTKFGANVSELRIAILIILTVALVLTGIAFFSSNWLEAERRYYGSKFKKLGLWRMCFNSYSAPDDFQLKKFYVGCRWVFADEYKPIRKFLLPGACCFVVVTLLNSLTSFLFYLSNKLIYILTCISIPFPFFQLQTCNHVIT